MKPSSSLLFASVLVVSALHAQTVQPPFDALYSMTGIGAIPGLTANYGAIVFDREDPNTLLCSTWSTVGVMNLHAIRVVRDAQGHVTGFSGIAAPRAQADFIDGGLDYHPGGVLFYTRYVNSAGQHGVGQFRPGSTVPDRVDQVLGPTSVGGLAIVPPGLPGAGRLKTLRWPGGLWTDAQLVPDAAGTFDIVGEAPVTTLSGGPDGFVYVPRMAPLFTGADVLVAEYNLGNLAAYAVDAQGDPIPGTRQVFATGLSSAFVMTVDPVTLDVLHASWSGTTVHVIRGFGSSCGQYSHYGSGLAGTGGRVPRITGFGCPLRGEQCGVHVGDRLPNAVGLLAVGFTPQSVLVFGGTLLNEGAAVLIHVIAANGNYRLPLTVPPAVGGFSLHFQAGAIDPGAVQGFSMSDGLVMPIL